MIKIGDELLLPPDGRRGEVVRFLGEGGQGTVFEVHVGDESQALAVKWYFPETATSSQRHSISLLVDQGPPSDRFLWPLGLIDSDGLEGFGYSMPLRPHHYAGLHELLSGKVEVGLGAVVDLCTELTHSFLLLHTRGLCYRDISFGNILFDPETGRPLICDNDNVGVNGQSPAAVLGTRRFMAPEIVRGEASPSTQTDLYSLAVLLFYVLMVGHPLVGRRELDFECWDEQAESELFGRNPLFIFDPIDTSNAPLEEQHDPVADNWSMFPAFIRELFTRAFTIGLREPRNRVQGSVWRRELARLRDQIGQCGWCGKENFLALGDQVRTCWFCERPLDRGTRLVFDHGRSVVLSERSRVLPHHIGKSYDFANPVAELVRHPRNPDLWGLRNAGSSAWLVLPPGREELEIVPGRSVTLVPGLKIAFGDNVTAILEV
jgi:eukaryotic-like serine/threonine-protein kinase